MTSWSLNGTMMAIYYITIQYLLYNIYVGGWLVYVMKVQAPAHKRVHGIKEREVDDSRTKEGLDMCEKKTLKKIYLSVLSFPKNLRNSSKFKIIVAILKKKNQNNKKRLHVLFLFIFYLMFYLFFFNWSFTFFFVLTFLDIRYTERPLNCDVI